MRNLWQLLLVGAVAFAVPTTVGAQSLGLKFAALDPDAATSSLMPTESAGVIAQQNWNNLDGATGSNAAPLVYDNSGTAVNSTATVSWQSPNTWRSTTGNNSFPAGPNRKLTAGYLDTGNTVDTIVSVTVSSIDQALRNTPYDVYVYFVSDSGANRGGGYTLTPNGGSPIVKYGSTMANPTMHVEDPGTDTDLSIDGTYLKFTGLTANGFTLTGDTTLTTPNGFRAPINAIQITPFVDIPGDVNGDQQVNLTDFHILRGNLFKTGQTRFQGDIAGADGVVNFADYREWKSSVPPGLAASVSLFGDGAIPEPTSAMLMVLGVAAAAFGTRRSERKSFPRSL
jgi:hypothetical protein